MIRDRRPLSLRANRQRGMRKPIVDGLIRTGRAANAQAENGFIRLKAKGAGLYWVSLDEFRLLRGETSGDVDELQAQIHRGDGARGRR